VLADDGVHLPRFAVLEAVPTEVLVGTILAVFPFGKEAFLLRLLFPVGLQFLLSCSSSRLRKSR